MIGKIVRAGIFAFVIAAPTAGIAAPGSVYDGRWSLSITTQQGTCETYNFPVQITNGAVTNTMTVGSDATSTTFPGVLGSTNDTADSLIKTGSGTLTPGSGSGRWTGKSGEARCSGTWTAQRS